MNAEPRLVVKADNLTAGYLPGINILNGCTLEAYAGELIGIIGPNGAGKSTLLKALFGLVNIRDGAVTLDGEDITNASTNNLVRKGIGWALRAYAHTDPEWVRAFVAAHRDRMSPLSLREATKHL